MFFTSFSCPVLYFHMKISLNWLGDFVDWIEKDPEEIARKITAHTAEVDEVEVQGALLERCCVGKVLTIKKHPNADSLQLCEVLTDKGSKHVVCGGENLREGMRVAFAHVGASVKWHGGEMMTLEAVKIRGEKSEGMICAASELGIEHMFPECTGKNIVDMGDGDEDVGKPLQEVFGMGDTVLHIDNHAITHRADLFSHFGFARECIAMGIAKWKSTPKINDIAFTNTPLPFKIHVDTPALVPRYSGCMLEIDSIGETPDWMKRKLEATGWRSLNLPIDITNYVIMEMGMPMHSFDADDLVGDLHMRTSKKGETVITLDETERELPDGALVISDDKGIFDLLGIMGGLRSSTKSTTKRIYLHGAILDPVTIRHGIVSTGHRTDGSTVYEKGVPACFSEPGLKRAVSLFLELVPGARVVSELESWGEDGKAEPIDLFAERTNALLGVEIEQKRMVQILTDLEFDVKDKGKGALSVTPPLHRLGDVKEQHDLIEEIGRMYGFDNIEPALPAADITPPERDQRVNTVRDSLKLDGYFELVPLSLVGPDLLQKCNIDAKAAQVGNPLGEELSLMQPSVLPGLLEHAERALRQTGDALCTFHIGHVFSEKGEHTELGMLVSARKQTDVKEDPFLQVKQHCSTALQAAGYSLDVKESSAPSYAHSERSADLIVDQQTIGQIFEVHPDVCKRFDLPARASAVLLNVDALLKLDAHTTVYEQLSQFPEVRYDETIEVKEGVSATSLLNAMQKASDLLQKVEVADMYKNNLTLRFIYGSYERTLTEEEVKKEHQKVMSVI